MDKRTNPNPSNFKVLSADKINNYTLAVIQFPDCNSYQQNKVLVYKGDRRKDLNEATVCEPHFTDEFLSPVARFQPTEEGRHLAEAFCRTNA